MFEVISKLLGFLRHLVYFKNYKFNTFLPRLIIHKGETRRFRRDRMRCSRLKHYLSATQAVVKRGCFSSSQQDRVVSEIYKKAVKVQILNEVALIHAVRNTC